MDSCIFRDNIIGSGKFRLGLTIPAQSATSRGDLVARRSRPSCASHHSRVCIIFSRKSGRLLVLHYLNFAAPIQPKRCHPTHTQLSVESGTTQNGERPGRRILAQCGSFLIGSIAIPTSLRQIRGRTARRSRKRTIVSGGGPVQGRLS